MGVPAVEGVVRRVDVDKRRRELSFTLRRRWKEDEVYIVKILLRLLRGLLRVRSLPGLQVDDSTYAYSRAIHTQRKNKGDVSRTPPSSGEKNFRTLAGRGGSGEWRGGGGVGRVDASPAPGAAAAPAAVHHMVFKT